jgi:hypothetical protein
MFHCLVLEMSNSSYSIFQLVVEKLIETVEGIEGGLFSVWVLNCGVQVPVLGSDRKSFSVQQYADCGEELCLPPRRLLFFDMAGEKELFVKYLNFLRGLEPRVVRYSVREMVSVLNKVGLAGKIPIVMVISELAIGDAESVREFASTLIFKGTTPFEIFAIESRDFQQNFDPLADFTLFLNARVHVCHPVEKAVLPSMIIGSLFDSKVTDAVIFVQHSYAFRVVDILGRGVRRNDLVFALSTAGPDDTVYFYLDYDVGMIKSRSPGVQFQVRYLDAFGRRVVRVMTLYFSIVEDPESCLIDFGAVLGAFAARAADKYRELASLDPISTVLANAKATFLDNLDAWVKFARGDRVAAAQFADSLANYHRLLSPRALAHVLGSSPTDVLRFVGPIGYALSLGSAEAVGPFTLTGRPVATGACYVPMPGGRGILLLAPGEEIGAWAEAIGQPPLTSALADICREPVVEIIAQSVSTGHPLLRHIEMCIAGG